MGWEIDPPGLYNLMMDIKAKWNKPILVTENGIPDNTDTLRANYIVLHLEQIKRAIDDGADVLGYIYWSLMDNYEWQEGYSENARFGLYYVDRNSENLVRIPTSGVAVLKQIIQDSNGGMITDYALLNARK